MSVNWSFEMAFTLRHIGVLTVVQLMFQVFWDVIVFLHEQFLMF